MDPTHRFSERADDYERYRPRYPEALGRWLAERRIGEGTVACDVGAGTGFLADRLLDCGCTVRLVEPNAEMLAHAKARLQRNPRVSFSSARAESTGLKEGSVDLVAAGQAFHWFDPIAAKAEFRRILRSGGRVLLVWNDRRAEDDRFMAEYEALLQTSAIDYAETTYRARGLDDRLRGFFQGEPEQVRLDNEQSLDQEGLIGRFFSSSYMPSRDDPRYPEAWQRAVDLFDRFQLGGRVVLRYYTLAHLGPV